MDLFDLWTVYHDDDDEFVIFQDNLNLNDLDMMKTSELVNQILNHDYEVFLKWWWYWFLECFYFSELNVCFLLKVLQNLTSPSTSIEPLTPDIFTSLDKKFQHGMVSMYIF